MTNNSCIFKYLPFLSSDTICGKYEKKLLRHLMVDYDDMERPVENETEPLMLTFGVTLQQIIDVVNNWIIVVRLTSLGIKMIHNRLSKKCFIWVYDVIINILVMITEYKRIVRIFNFFVWYKLQNHKIWFYQFCIYNILRS